MNLAAEERRRRRITSFLLTSLRATIQVRYADIMWGLEAGLKMRGLSFYSLMEEALDWIRAEKVVDCFWHGRHALWRRRRRRITFRALEVWRNSHPAAPGFELLAGVGAASCEAACLVGLAARHHGGRALLGGAAEALMLCVRDLVRIDRGFAVGSGCTEGVSSRGWRSARAQWYVGSTSTAAVFLRRVRSALRRCRTRRCSARTAMPGPE